jgi:hypothetical protein
MVKDEARESPVKFLEYLFTRRGSGGPQKPFSSLSEGVGGVLTVSTESSEIACILHLKIPNVPTCGATQSRGRFVRSRRRTWIRCSTVPWMI